MISGKSQSGKDTFGRILKEQLEMQNKKVLLIHFADPVKWLARDFFNWDGNKDIEGRHLLQWIGTDTMRKKYPSYWAEIIAKFISTYEAYFDYCLICDWRFKNEFETVCDYNQNVITVRINRYQNNENYYNPNMTLEQRWHISECEIDDFPFEWIIENRNDITTLEESAKFLLEHI